MLDIVNRFKALNLENYPEEAINRLIAEIGVVPIMRAEYHGGKVIYRARPHDNENEDFATISDLSYKPERNNNTYQRASTPHKTMFYGALIPEEIGNDLIDDERIIGAFEVVDFLRNPSIKEGEKVISYGVWRVNSTISTYSIIHSKIDKIKVGWLRKIARTFYNNLEKLPQFKDKTPIIQNYLAGEFSKHIGEGKDYHYMISAMFSKKVCDRGVDGILYPSVKMKGTGLNISLTPECVDSKLSLVSAIKCKVYKKCKKVIINNLKKGIVNQVTGTISWEEIPIGRYRATEEEIRNRLSHIKCPKNKRRNKSKKWKMVRLMQKRERKNTKRETSR